ncbi:3193_t:CDS:2 [Funneliformis caledonium]|uniref:3193_t:CDS:1 n=1 Tax=Funneliformis caledonium TaxID=1117310 RepID=A0A9N8WBS3_9GLOM|nr:3193_t:CDS:2 [Funneliformis caledonium]
MNEQDNEHVQWLNKWYCKCRHKYIDLVGDFGGSELFVIEGDSLLFKFLYDPESDFLDFSQPFCGGQFLALTFLVENFLNKLKERKCVFHVVFFDDYQSLWNNQPVLRIAREIIIDHLKSQNTGVPIVNFKNWWSPEWNEYLANRQPLFTLVGDGSTEHLEIDVTSEEIQHDSPLFGIATKNSLKMTVVFRAFLFHSLHIDLPVALLPGMEFRESRAYAFVFERSESMGPEILNKSVELAKKVLQVYDEKSVWFKGPVKKFNLNSSCKDLLTSQEFLQVWSNGGKRIALILLSLTGVLCDNVDKPDFQYLAKIFLLHTIILDYLPLNLRTSPPVDDDEHVESNSRIQLFLKFFYDYCAKVYISDILLESIGNFQDLNKNLYDLVDARLFASLIKFQYDDVLNLKVLPSEIKNRFDESWNLLKRLCECNGLVDALNLDNDEKFRKKFPIEFISKSSLEFNDVTNILPFQFEFIEEYFGDMHLSLPENSGIKIDSGYYGLTRNVYYDDTIHWHSKRKTEGKDRVHNPKHANSWKRKGYQQYKESASAKAMKEKIKKDKLEKSLNDSEQYLDNLLKEVLKDKDLKNQINILNTGLEKENKLEHPFSKFRGHFKKLELLVKLWAEQCKGPDVGKGFAVPVDILYQVFYIVQNFPDYLGDKRKKNLLEIIDRLKLNTCLNNCKERLKKKKPDPDSKGKGDSFKFNLPRDSIDLSIGMSDTRLQLLYADHLMERNTNSVEDPRDESALICCPTSSGKTFISFYAMEKVLKESDDGILVYVAPTKALVNQVTAEVYGRFKKTYEQTDKTTWGIHTREYRENHEKCQILVTVPQMLEILILSPKRASWAQNIKRIIFDEVHMIGFEEGEFYDRLLLMSKSIPILALSATIGNPETFRDWLSKSRGSMRLIKTTKRFSDLQQYVYLPKFPLPSLLETTINPKGSQRRTSSIVPINPMFSLSTVILKENGIPGDMKLIPPQCVQLWDEMKKFSGDNPPRRLVELDPDVYFKDIGYIVKDDADKYEQELKQAFEEFSKDDSLNEMTKSTIEELGTGIKKGFADLESGAEGLHVYGDEFYKEAMVPLLCELSAQDKLPAILFHFDRKGCVELALLIYEQLHSAEQKKRADDQEYQSKKKAAIAQKEKFEKDLKRKRDSKPAKTSTKDEDPPGSEEPMPKFFDWEAHDPDFTFVRDRDRVPSDEFEEILGPTLKMKEPLLIEALKRGIGVHHAGLPRKYLSAVEILFRRRQLRVVIATGTLALGINMPCKTVIFVGDSVFLGALQYRQMSGRAGRRGFDLRGHVIFFGINITKISRLLMSGLPNLSGHFPLSTTLMLRSFNLINQCKVKSSDDNYAKNIVKGLFCESLFSYGNQYLSEQVKYHLRFSIEYLMRESLLDRRGNMINLSDMVSYLYYTEPSNFVFAALFKHGIFHKICKGLKASNEKVMNELILILSHLFNRVKLRKISGGFYQNTEYPSKVILDPLPESVSDVLEDYNKRVLNMYTEYVVNFAKQNATKLGPNNSLPLSSIKIPPKSMDQALKEDPLISTLESSAISFTARSPFISMCSSLGDIFQDLEDLTSHIHSKIYLDLHSIPYVNNKENLNAYISDFFSHGQEVSLVKANGISRSDVWQVLNNFNLVLTSIIVCLQLRSTKNLMLDSNLREEEELVLKGFEMIQKHFEDKFIEIWA